MFATSIRDSIKLAACNSIRFHSRRLKAEFETESKFAYGDSCRTGDDKYVIAQFKFDASMSWAADLRSFLNLRELKYKFFEPRRYQVQSKADLWKRVTEGVFQAEITIADPSAYKHEVILTLLDERAEPGIDFDMRIVNRAAARSMIAASPLGLANVATSDFVLNDDEAASFDAEAIHERAGGKLNDAVVVAARSHAMVGPKDIKTLVEIMCLEGNLADGLAIARSTQRSRLWDIEHPRSLPILNDLSDRIAYLAAGRLRLPWRRGLPAVEEGASVDSLHLQAADMAAGWSANLLTLTGGDYRSLAQKFASVSVNGIVYPG